ncbi:MAG: dephospho-CoA kinase [Pseudomonadota bacterium]
MTIVIGLTGSIGMGKTTTARLLKEAGAAIFDADACVHNLYAEGGEAVAGIAQLFPEAVQNNTVNRQKLSQVVLKNPDAIKEIEALVHPLVAIKRQAFLDKTKAENTKYAVFDVPLLLENGGDEAVDIVLVVTAPESIQKQRVLARPGMTVEKFQALRNRQMPENEKKARADYVIYTDKGEDDARRQIQIILEDIEKNAVK